MMSSYAFFDRTHSVIAAATLSGFTWERIAERFKSCNEVK